MWNVLARPVLASVIPAKAGIHAFPGMLKHWIPAFAGMTSHDISRLLQYPSVHNANGRPLGRPFCFCEI